MTVKASFSSPIKNAATEARLIKKFSSKICPFIMPLAAIKRTLFPDAINIAAYIIFATVGVNILKCSRIIAIIAAAMQADRVIISDLFVDSCSPVPQQAQEQEHKCSSES